MRQAGAQDVPYNHMFANQVDPKLAAGLGQGWLNEEEQSTAADLFLEYQKQVKSMGVFLEVEYASFQNKMNQCLLQRCYSDIFKEREYTRDCARGCTEGVQAVKGFVENQLDLMQQEFHRCIEKSNKDKYMIQSAFRCYDNLNKSFEVVKVNIREELNYYQ